MPHTYNLLLEFLQKGDYISMDKSYEMYRFICLSIVAIAPMIAFALSDVEITPIAPIGLITKLCSK